MTDEEIWMLGSQPGWYVEATRWGVSAWRTPEGILMASSGSEYLDYLMGEWVDPTRVEYAVDLKLTRRDKASGEETVVNSLEWDKLDYATFLVVAGLSAEMQSAIVRAWAEIVGRQDESVKALFDAAGEARGK